MQLLRMDQTPYLEEFETSNSLYSQDGATLVATPINRRDETGSEGSRESSTSGDSRPGTKSLLNSSLISAQSDVILRRQRDGVISPYVSTPVLLRHDDVDSRRDRSTTHDVSAFRKRQVRSAIYTENDWSPGRLGRPRSMDSLDKVSSNPSTLTPSDALSGDDDMSGTLPRTIKQGMMKHVSPKASPRGLRKPLWAQSSPNISPVPPRKEYPISMDNLPPSPPSPASSRRSASPRSSPILARKVDERPTVRSPKHSPVLSRKENSNTFSPPSGSRRTSMPNYSGYNLDTVPVRERALDPSIPKVSVQIVSSANTNAASATLSRSTAMVSLSSQDDQWKRIPVGDVVSSAQSQRLNGDVSESIPVSQERQRSGTDERHDQPTTSTPRGSFTEETAEPSRNNFQHTRERSSSGNKNDGPLDSRQTASVHSRERSFSGDRNSGLRVGSEPSRNNAQHIRERSFSANKNDVPHTKEGPLRDSRQMGPAHSRERSLSGDRNSGLRVIQGKDAPSRDNAQTPPVHVRSFSADRNDGLRASQRQGTLFVASSLPRQSVPVTAHYVTSGNVARSEPLTAVTSGVGTGVKSSSVSAVPLGNRPDVSSSTVYAVVRDKRGDEHVMSASNTPPSRELAATPRDQTSQSHTPLSNSVPTPPSSSSASRNASSADTSTPRNGVVANPVELKPSLSEQRDENRNKTKLRVTAAVVPDTSKQAVSGVRSRILEIEHQSPPRASQAHAGEDDDDDACSVSSQQSRDCSPALRKVRNKAKKAGKEKEIFVDSPTSSETGSTASGRRSTAEERSRARSVGPKDTEGKQSSVWYEYGCV